MHTMANILSTVKNIGFQPKFTLEKGIKAYIPEILKTHGKNIS